ncbi:porin family protein [Spirosoma flavum]|uniref:PorT family protein n=1 Tax=Spirosoma flavum TaxID=2048557 RepID=A0ABW6AEG9_9BACT
MSELTDDQLDGLFRKSAEEFDPPFDPTAWQDMKNQLDTHDRTMTGGTPLWKNVLRWGLLACVLLLLLVGGWYTYRSTSSHLDSSPVTVTKLPLKGASNQPKLTTTATQPQRSASAPLAHTDSALPTPTSTLERPVDNKDQSAVLAEPVRKSKAVETDNQPDRLVNRLGESPSPKLDRVSAKNDNLLAYKVEPKRSETTHMPRTTEKALSVTVRQRTQRMKTERLLTQKQWKANRTTDRAPFSTMNYAMPSASSFGKQHRINDPKLNQMTPTGTGENVAKPALDKVEAVLLPPINELSIRPAHWSKALTFTGRDVVVVAQPDTVSHSVVPKPPVQLGLSVRLAIAPDLSSVGLNNFSRPGTNIGVLVEYRFASRWSVQTGVIQSTKVYRAQANEYNLPWSWPVDPTSIDGRCNMFDIPINVRYDFAVRPRSDGRLPSRWFVNGGVTSYIMNQENYVYNYPPHTYNQPTEKAVNTGGYGFSNLNLSTGYERTISRRLSWQVEPFVKVPIKSVGFFKVNLLSTGVFFSIRYKL